MILDVFLRRTSFLMFFSALSLQKVQFVNFVYFGKNQSFAFSPKKQLVAIEIQFLAMRSVLIISQHSNIFRTFFLECFGFYYAFLLLQCEPTLTDSHCYKVFLWISISPHYLRPAQCKMTYVVKNSIFSETIKFWTFSMIKIIWGKTFSAMCQKFATLRFDSTS